MNHRVIGKAAFTDDGNATDGAIVEYADLTAPSDTEWGKLRLLQV